MGSAKLVSLLGVVLASVKVSSAGWNVINASDGGAKFTVVDHDTGQTNPYRLRVNDSDTLSLYTFNSTRVMQIKVGRETYKVFYDSSYKLEDVEQTTPTRRELAVEGNDATTMEERRLRSVYYCTDCELAWNAMCANVPSVCDLVEYGSPFSAEAEASIRTTCNGSGSLCSSLTASGACQGQCTEEPASVVLALGRASLPEIALFSEAEVIVNINTCLDPTSEDYKCSFSQNTVMSFDSCGLTDDDVPFLPGCFEKFGRNTIVTLDMYKNEMKTLPEGLFNGLTNLEELNMGRNDIESLPEGVFSDLSSLRELYMFQNSIATVAEGVFDGLTKLEVLYMHRNELASLPEGVFSDLASLQDMTLDRNDLETLPEGLFAGLTKLESLELEFNGLESLSDGIFYGLVSLQTLHLESNDLVTLPEGLFSGLTKLEHLYMAYNDLEILSDGLFAGLVSLQTLELYANNLSIIGSSLSGLEELRTLLLGYHCCLELAKDTFADLVSLEDLNFQHCGLTTLPAGIFSPMVNLEFLDLSYNSDLQCLPDTTATDIDLERVDNVYGTCECTPVEAVFCDDGFVCQSGNSGYLCAAE